MKPQTFLRLSLLTPYLLWGMSAIVALVVSSSKNTAFDTNPIMNTLLYIPMLYAFGIFIWGIPYTLLAVGLGLWSRNKPSQKALKTFVWSPVMLAVLIAFEVFAFSLNWNDLGAGFSQNSIDFGASILAMGALAIVFGYLSIGVVAGIYKVLTLRNLIKNEEQMLHPAPATFPNQTTL
ncbi:MAG: hypothetical protein ABI904_16005 [Chloroflexota bacterium]